MANDLFQNMLFTTQFTSVVQALLQQHGSLLRPCVESRSDYRGKQAAVVNQIGAVSMQSPAGRFLPKNRTDPLFNRRWVFPKPKELNQLIDPYDLEETIVDPKAFYVQNAVDAVGRAWDDEIIGALFGTAQTGQDQSSFAPETFNTSSVDAATPGFTVLDTYGSSNSTGMTVSKLIRVEQALRHYHNTQEMNASGVYLLLGSQQLADLQRQVQFVSTEFRNSAVYDSGTGALTKFMSFNMVVTERLATQTASGSGQTVRNCAAFVRSGMHLGIWMELMNRVSIRNDLSGEPYQLFTQAMFGATRTQPGKVFQILCKDATGGDITA